MLLALETKKAFQRPSCSWWYNVQFAWSEKGCSGGLVVSVLSFNSNDLGLNSAEGYSFYLKTCLKRTYSKRVDRGF